MQTPSSRVLVTRSQIATRVTELGGELTRYYEGRRPLFFGVMNGALFFLADLVRAVNLDVEISCMRLSSYVGTRSSGTVKGLHDEDLLEAVRGREVLVVDDILDTGRTLQTLVANLLEHGATDVKTCVLLDKQRSQERFIGADWTGFRIPDEFVVGYGLDHDGRFRQLRDICVLNHAEVGYDELSPAAGMADIER